MNENEIERMNELVNNMNRVNTRKKLNKKKTTHTHIQNEHL